jgi:hypothetical protein
MGVDHGRFHAGVAEEFLNGANVVARFEQTGGEIVAQGMDGGAFAQVCQTASGFEGAGDGAWLIRFTLP